MTESRLINADCNKVNGISVRVLWCVHVRFFSCCCRKAKVYLEKPCVPGTKSHWQRCFWFVRYVRFSSCKHAVSILVQCVQCGTLLWLHYPPCHISHGSLSSFVTDAFARVIFTHLASDTRVIWETRSPTWDQMLVFKDVILWGDVNEIAVNPPTIVIEIFDKDLGV